MASEGRAQEPWKRPHCYALAGQAYVYVSDNRLSEAIGSLEEAASMAPLLGSALQSGIDATLVEAFLSAGRPEANIADVYRRLIFQHTDPRQLPSDAAAMAIASHVSTDCQGECLAALEVLEAARAQGAVSMVLFVGGKDRAPADRTQRSSRCTPGLGIRRAGGVDPPGRD